MPYVNDVGWVLGLAQENLRKDVMASCLKMKDYLSNDSGRTRQDPLSGHRIGWVISENIRHQVNYVPNYGCFSHQLAATNGSAWTLASACMENAIWEEDIEENNFNERSSDRNEHAGKN